MRRVDGRGEARLALRAGALPLLLLVACARAPEAPPVSAYVGAARCGACHPEAYTAWQASAHARNMAAPSYETVVGDFEHANTYAYAGTRSRMFRNEDGAYFMAYTGPDGREETLSIDYVLGVRRHQTYLHREPDGRLQVLPTYWSVTENAWRDSTEGPVPGPGPLTPKSPDHWRGPTRTYNRECQECHAGHGAKNYDAKTHGYASEFEPAIDCEACHGPGAAHARAWERQDAAAAKGTLAPVTIETCDACHARKRIYADGYTPGAPFYDFFAPDVWEAGSFFADGRARNLNYTFVDFRQNRCGLEARGCGACHPPHDLTAAAGRTVKRANALCTGCHVDHATRLTAHTHHAPESEGSRCIECHMPRVDLDVRMSLRDHGVTSPLPGLAGVPDACTTCHRDRPASWAESFVGQWFGATPHFQAYRRRMLERVETLTPLFTGGPVPVATLTRWLADPTESIIARASAALFLGDAHPDPDALRALLEHRHDPQPLVRFYVVCGIAAFDAPPALDALREALADPARVVRVRAYETLVVRRPEIDRDPAFAQVRAEQARRADVVRADDPRALSQEAMARYLRGDASGAEQRLRDAAAIGGPVEAPRLELVQFLVGTGHLDEAEREMAALDPAGVPGGVARALLLLARGRNDEARALLDRLPDDPAVRELRAQVQR
jgi:predicted CXXCH cytochrome family protein